MVMTCVGYFVKLQFKTVEKTSDIQLELSDSVRFCFLGRVNRLLFKSELLMSFDRLIEIMVLF